MATRIAARYISRRLSSGGKIFSEEEKAAENIYIKKMEQERLAKAGQKGAQPGEKPTAAASEAKPSGDSSSTNVSTDSNRNYAVLAGVVTVLGAYGWYYKASKKKPEEVQD